MKRLIILSGISFFAATTPIMAQSLRDSADKAWNSGSSEDALRLYSRIVVTDPGDATALHRMALIYAWSERYGESLALFDRILRISAEDADVRLDRARVLAWTGQTAAAVRAIDSLIAKNPKHFDAIQLRAQFLSWEGNYDEALRSFDRLLEITPDNRSTRIGRARVLQWAERFNAAIAVYDSLLRADPNDREAFLGMGNVLAIMGKNDSAEVIFQKLLIANPRDVEALRGSARSAAWRGSLRKAELLLTEAELVAPRDVALLTAHAQTLRWQGRDAAAKHLLIQARTIAPINTDVRDEIRWADLALAPHANGNSTYESDSDGNRITSTASSFSFRTTDRFEIRGEGYNRQARSANAGKKTANSYGGMIGGWVQIEPGWGAALSAGRSKSLVPSAKPFTLVRAAIETPGWFTLGAAATYSRSALDETIILAERQVYTDNYAIDAHSLLNGSRLFAGAGISRFKSRVSNSANRRWNVSAALTKPITRTLRIGTRARAFGFEKDLNDGYFDPDFYGLAEITTEFTRQSNHWSLSLDGAPGVQKVRKGGEISGAFRIGSRLAFLVSPGRTIGLSVIRAKSGLQQFSANSGGDYRYTAVTASGNWVF